MSKLRSSVLEVRPGHSRVPVVWLAPARIREYEQAQRNLEQRNHLEQLHQNDRAARAGAAAQGPAGIPASAGRWVERAPNTFARQRVAIPITVGSHLR